MTTKKQNDDKEADRFGDDNEKHLRNIDVRDMMVASSSLEVCVRGNQ